MVSALTKERAAQEARNGIAAAMERVRRVNKSGEARLADAAKFAAQLDDDEKIVILKAAKVYKFSPTQNAAIYHKHDSGMTLAPVKVELRDTLGKLDALIAAHREQIPEGCAMSQMLYSSTFDYLRDFMATNLYEKGWAHLKTCRGLGCLLPYNVLSTMITKEINFWKWLVNNKMTILPHGKVDDNVPPFFKALEAGDASQANWDLCAESKQKILLFNPTDPTMLFYCREARKPDTKVQTATNILQLCYPYTQLVFSGATPIKMQSVRPTDKEQGVRPAKIAFSILAHSLRSLKVKLGGVGAAGGAIYDIPVVATNTESLTFSGPLNYANFNTKPV